MESENHIKLNRRWLKYLCKIDRYDRIERIKITADVQVLAVISKRYVHHNGVFWYKQTGKKDNWGNKLYEIDCYARVPKWNNNVWYLLNWNPNGGQGYHDYTHRSSLKEGFDRMMYKGKRIGECEKRKRQLSRQMQSDNKEYLIALDKRVREKNIEKLRLKNKRRKNNLQRSRERAGAVKFFRLMEATSLLNA